MIDNLFIYNISGSYPVDFSQQGEAWENLAKEVAQVVKSAFDSVVRSIKSLSGRALSRSASLISPSNASTEEIGEPVHLKGFTPLESPVSTQYDGSSEESQDSQAYFDSQNILEESHSILEEALSQKSEPVAPSSPYSIVQGETMKTLSGLGLTLGKNLGAGTSGGVYLAGSSDSIKKGNKPLAVKLLKHSEVLSPTLEALENTRLASGTGEGLALLLPKKSHLARAYGVLAWDPKQQVVHYVTSNQAKEYNNLPIIGTVSRAQKCDLFDYIAENELSTLKIQELGYAIAEGIQALHKSGVEHYDLKPGNILIKENGKIKITDFGFATHIPTKGRVKRATGSPGYIDPEVRFYGNRSTAADWYSFGMILYKMTTRYLDFDSNGIAMLNPSLIKDKNLHDLLFNKQKGLVNHDPDSRYSGEEVLAHSFFLKQPPSAKG